MRLLFLTLFSLCSLTSQAITLSGTARISLMTVAPGAELYSTFGHSALRVFDPERGLDKIYNYGTFDFDQPNFYLNFVRGRLLYSLATESFRSFEYGNRLEQRQMKEQVLALRPDQKQRLFDLLEENATPANRDYLYDFFYDNCATRIRDVLQKATSDSLQWERNQLPEGTTLRDLLGFYLTEHPWTQYGINLVLGKPTDRLADTYSSMFLPDYLHDAVSGARFLNGQSLLFAENVGPDYPPGSKVEQRLVATPLFDDWNIVGDGYIRSDISWFWTIFRACILVYFRLSGYCDGNAVVLDRSSGY